MASVADDSGWIPSCDRERWHVTCNHRARADDRTRTYRHARENYGARANPNVVLDRHKLWRGVGLVPYWEIHFVKCVTESVNDHFRPHEYVAPNVDGSIHAAPNPDAGSFTYMHLP